MLATLLYLAPFVTVIGLLASGRAGGLGAGWVGLLVALPAVAYRIDDRATLPGFLIEQSARGAWLAWQAVAVIIAGFFFHRAVVASAPPSVASDASAGMSRSRYRDLFRACFMLGIFAESLTGFGVGYLIAFAAVVRLGVTGVHAVVIAGFSQVAVAFGALAVGTGIGASLAGISLAQMGQWTATLLAPLFVGHLLLFWRMTNVAGIGPSRGDRAIDVLCLALLVGLLYLFSALNIVELAGLSAAGLLLVCDVIARDRELGSTAWRERWTQVWPYVAVTVALLASRLIPGARDALAGLAQTKPFVDQAAFAWFYNPLAYLVAVGLVAVIVRGAWPRVGAIVAASAKGAWRAVAVTLIFVIFGQWLTASGVATALAGSATTVLGTSALLVSPLVGALAGFLTGSNTGSNAMAMPIQAALATSVSVVPGLLPALQNAMGSSLALLAPPRVAMMKGFAGAGTSEAMILRALAPIGVMVVAVGFAIVVLVLLI